MKVLALIARFAAGVALVTLTGSIALRLFGVPEYVDLFLAAALVVLSVAIFLILLLLG